MELFRVVVECAPTNYTNLYFFLVENFATFAFEDVIFHWSEILLAYDFKICVRTQFKPEKESFQIKNQCNQKLAKHFPIDWLLEKWQINNIGISYCNYWKTTGIFLLPPL